MNITVRTRDSSSPATEVAITSIARGLASGEMVNSMEKWPSASGTASLPLTLTVASGEEIPVTVMLLESTTMSSGGKVTSNCNAADWGTGDDPGVAAGPGDEVGVGGRVGGVTAVGEEGAVAATVGTTFGISDETEVALGVGMGFVGTEVGWTGVNGRVSAGTVAAGCSAGDPAGVPSSPPHAAIIAVSKRTSNAAADSSFAGKVRTRIPTLP